MRHRGEVEFDFRTILHTSLVEIARDDDDEAWRLLRILRTRTDSHVGALTAGWERPFSQSDILLASVYSAVSGERHPLMPEMQDRSVSETDIRLADLALERMNRR